MFKELEWLYMRAIIILILSFAAYGLWAGLGGLPHGDTSSADGIISAFLMISLYGNCITWLKGKGAIE